MNGLDELRARVASIYDNLGMPSWPDPHPDAGPREDEYSRVTEPERYRVVHARGQAWATALGELPGVSVEPIGAGRVVDDLQFSGGARVTSSRPGTQPLLLLERLAPQEDDDDAIAVLHICFAEPRISVHDLPDCGCDACDCGSDDLLTAIDDDIGHIVGGPFVALRGPNWHADWHPDGGGAGGDGDSCPGFSYLMDLCEQLSDGNVVRLPPKTEAFVGRAWFD